VKILAATAARILAGIIILAALTGAEAIIETTGITLVKTKEIIREVAAMVMATASMGRAATARVATATVDAVGMVAEAEAKAASQSTDSMFT
jgi:hypothetical protein